MQLKYTGFNSLISGIQPPAITTSLVTPWLLNCQPRKIVCKKIDGFWCLFPHFNELTPSFSIFTAWKADILISKQVHSQSGRTSLMRELWSLFQDEEDVHLPRAEKKAVDTNL